MKIYWGKPKNPGELKFSRMEVSGLYGVSFDMRFVGIMTFGERGFENSKPEPWYEAQL